MSRLIFHIDVNNAYLSWTALKLLSEGSKKDIRKTVSVIAGEKRSGIVVAKSEEAKKYGIQTGDTIYQCMKKYKNVETYLPDREYYNKKSNQLYEILYKYSPDIEKYSIDEYFVDFTKCSYLYNDYMKLANDISNEIKTKLGFTVNIGIGNTKVCAKMAGEFSKPDKIHTLFQNEIIEKLHPLDISQLFMLGKKSVVKMKELNINTIGDLANFNRDFIYSKFKKHGLLLHNYANGIDDSIVQPHIAINEGISHAITLNTDINNIDEIKRIINILSSKVGKRLRDKNKYAKVVTLKLRDRYFKDINHSKTLTNVINTDMDIYKTAVSLFEDIYDDSHIRLISVGVSSLTDIFYKQLSIFDDEESYKIEDKLQKVIDDINLKYKDNMNYAKAFKNDK